MSKLSAVLNIIIILSALLYVYFTYLEYNTESIIRGAYMIADEEALKEMSDELEELDQTNQRARAFSTITLYSGIFIVMVKILVKWKIGNTNKGGGPLRLS